MQEIFLKPFFVLEIDALKNNVIYIDEGGKWERGETYFLANVILIACVGDILKPCRASFAAPDWYSFSNSTNAMSKRPGTRRTSLKPGNCTNNTCNIVSLVSGGRLVKNRMLFGGCSASAECGMPAALRVLPVARLARFSFFFFFVSSDRGNLGRSTYVPLSLDTKSLSFLAYAICFLKNSIVNNGNNAIEPAYHRLIVKWKTLH